jgi:hypothetical protein
MLCQKAPAAATVIKVTPTPIGGLIRKEDPHSPTGRRSWHLPLRRKTHRLPIFYGIIGRHSHSILSASLESIRAWSGRQIESPPVRMADFNAMRAYLHSELYPVIYNRTGFEFAAERAIRESVQDGVRILEMSFDVNFIQFYGTGESGFLYFIRNLASKHRDALEFRPEVGVSKGRDASTRIYSGR